MHPRTLNFLTVVLFVCTIRPQKPNEPRHCFQRNMEGSDDHPSRDFSDSQMKPKPLRIARKDRSTEKSGCDSLQGLPSKDNRIDEPAPDVDERPDEAQEQHSTTTDCPASSSKQNSPALAALVSKFETLDALSSSKPRHQNAPGIVVSKQLANSSRVPVDRRTTSVAAWSLEHKTNKENMRPGRTWGLDGHTGNSED
jgi:hypothetical protein